MNLQGKIEYIKNAVTAIKNAIVNKGVTPAGDLSTYADAISDIEIKNNTSLTVNPSTSSQTIRVPAEYTGYDVVTVNPVTNAIDVDITASNIKQGVNILGVSGNVIELKGETRTFNANGTYIPSSGKNGMTSVTVNVTDTSTDNLIQGNITSVDTNVSSIRGGAFANCENLNTVTLRSNTVVDLSDDTIFENTPIEDKTGNIYVPDSLLSAYKVPHFTNNSTPISGDLNYINNIRVIYDGNNFICVGYHYETGNNQYWVYSSSNGVDWTYISSLTSRSSSISSIAYGNGYYIVLPYGGHIQKSPNASTWIDSSHLSSSYTWSSVTYGNNSFIALSEEGRISISNNTGESWSTATNILDNSYTWKSIAYGNSRFVAISEEGVVNTSLDGSTWTAISSLPKKDSSVIWKFIFYENDKFMAVGTYIENNSTLFCCSFLFDNSNNWNATQYSEDIGYNSFDTGASSVNKTVLIGQYGTGLVSDNSKYNFLPISQLPS